MILDSPTDIRHNLIRRVEGCLRLLVKEGLRDIGVVEVEDGRAGNVDLKLDQDLPMGTTSVMITKPNSYIEKLPILKLVRHLLIISNVVKDNIGLQDFLISCRPINDYGVDH